MGTARRRSRRSGEPARSTVPLAARFTSRYIIALALFAGVGLLSISFIRDTLTHIEHNTDLLELAAEQPGHVHRMVELGRTLDAAGEVDNIRAMQDASSRLNEERAALELAHDELVGRDRTTGAHSSTLPVQLEELYYGAARLDLDVSEYASAAKELANYSEPDEAANRAPLLARLSEGADPLIADMQTAITLYSQDTNRAIDAQRDRDLLVLLLGSLATIGAVVVLFSPMARSIRIETSNLEAAERVHRENNERQTFRNELGKALEVCEDEDEVVAAAGRAMAEVVPESPGELLMVDEQRSHLQVAVVNPAVGGANCPVDSPNACAALRAGQTMVYESSRMLNVCPKLPQHDRGPCSAVCVPLVFNGEAIGVLHAVAEENQVLGTAMAERFGVLGQVTATRIGTLRITKATERLAARDVLTDLDNRRTLLAKAGDLVSAHRPFSLAVADLDHFKDLNDTYGHETGDRALQLFSECMRKHLRPEDVVARWGGEEFVVVLPDTSIDAATVALERLQVALVDELEARSSVPFTASWGLTDSGSATTFQEMLNVADIAMYEAKRAGRNCLVVDGDAARRHQETVLSSRPDGDGSGRPDGEESDARHDGLGADHSATAPPGQADDVTSAAVTPPPDRTV